MPNFLKPEKVLKIREMSAVGATKREIAHAVGVSLPAVARYWLRGVPSENGNAALETRDSCRLHPTLDAAQVEALKATRVCPKCRSEGSVRHHARRKAEGRPIVPPIRRPRAAPANDVVALVAPVLETIQEPPEPAQIPPKRAAPRATVTWRDPGAGLVGAAIHGVSSDDQLVLWADAKKGDLWSRDLLVAANLAFVRREAERFARQCRHLTVDDLVAEGSTGILHAIDLFDPEMGIKFLTYASQWIVQRIRRAVDQTEREIRVPLNSSRMVKSTAFRKAWDALRAAGLSQEEAVESIAKSLRKRPETVEAAIAGWGNKRAQSLDAPIGSEGDGETALHHILPSESEGQHERLARVRSALAVREAVGRLRPKLDPIDTAILDLRLMAYDEEEQTEQEIAERFGKSRQLIHQRSANLKERLKKHLRAFKRELDE